MVQPTQPVIVSRKAQEGILQFHRQAYQQLNQQWNIREQMRQIDLKYIRENDWTTENQRAKLANRYGDSTKYQNITVPVVMPAVESAVEYQVSVFLTGVPIFGVVADPTNEDQALQMETVIDNNSVRGGWTRELMLAFRDGFKYNLACVEVDWCREVTAAFDTDMSFSPTQGKPKEIIWEGNRMTHMDMYNTFFDSRVPITEHHKKGEFAGYTKLYSRMALKQFINSLPDKMNVTEAFESGMGSAVGGFGTGGIESFYIPQLNPDALINKNPRASVDWMAWAGIAGNNLTIAYKNMYEVTVVYGRIIPSDFGLKVPQPNTPQVWKFIIVNHQVLVYAERQTNAHGYIPLLFMQPLEDGLSYQTKSMASNVAPIQDVSTALMNSIIASRRRAISDRVLYDPSRITEANMNSENPSAKIPVRPAAYGKNVAESVYQFPYREDQAQISMSEIQGLQGFANYISGQNPARQGQFVKGNKTLHEYSDVMSHANGRDQMTAMLLEAQFFTPAKEIMKIDILQYQGGISLFNRAKQQQVKIDPVSLRKAVLNFKVSDGLVPTDKLIGAEAFQVSLQVIGSSPQIQAGYNIGPMFSYMMKTQGADLSTFEKSPEQLAYEQAVQQWQQTVGPALEAAAKSGQSLDPKSLPPQPVPQQYGYNPQQQGSSAAAAPQPQVKSNVNNITNNITDNRTQ